MEIYRKIANCSRSLIVAALKQQPHLLGTKLQQQPLSNRSRTCAIYSKTTLNYPHFTLIQPVLDLDSGKLLIVAALNQQPLLNRDRRSEGLKKKVAAASISDFTVFFCIFSESCAFDDCLSVSIHKQICQRKAQPQIFQKHKKERGAE